MPCAQVPNLHALYADLFHIASEVLRDDGRLVFVNPLRVTPKGALASQLTLESRLTVDLGLRRDCSVEVWRKAEAKGQRDASRRGRRSKSVASSTKSNSRA